jgi:hypothetical protein
VFKYFTKLVAQTRLVAPAALDIIFQSMKGLRVYQSVGFSVAKEPPDEDSPAIVAEEGTDAPTRKTERIVWEWRQELTDWIDFASGMCLTGYEPDESFRRMVESVTAPQSLAEALGVGQSGATLQRTSEFAVPE